MKTRLLVSMCAVLIVWLAVSSCAAQTMALPESVFYWQCDLLWGSDPLGTGCTICSVGAPLTCGSMLLSWVAETLSPDPGELNQWLTANGGYFGCNLIWSVVAEYDGQGSGLEWLSRTTFGFDDWAALDAELAMPDRMPLVNVLDGSHWVVVYERDGPSGIPGSYRVLDPGQQSFSADRTLADFNPGGGQIIFGMSVYTGAFPTPQRVFFDGFESGTALAWSNSSPPIL